MKRIVLSLVAGAALAALALVRAAWATPPDAAQGLEAEVAALVTQALPAQLALTDVSAPASLAKRRGPVQVAWKSAPRAGRVSVLVTVGQGPTAARGWVSLELAEVRRVLVARRALAAGARLAAGDVRLELRPVEAGAALELDPAAVAGARLAADVPAGAPLPAASVTLLPPLARGTALRVVVRRGQVSVTTSGVLERAARVGERAGARVAPSERVLEGRLVDDHTLVVEGE
jgi:flagella basal body P-ring formation protein FlgA